MGNSHQGVKQKVLKARQIRLSQQMLLINESAANYGLTYERATKISTLNVQEVVALLNKGELTSEELLDSLALRCSTAGKQLNVFTETNFEWALKAAKACDLQRKESGKRNWTPEDGEFNQDKFLPALYGIPISIKDSFHMEGLRTTIGLFCKAENYQPESVLIKCLKNTGLIPFMKTNIPQLLMSIQTHNNLWGKTLNPWNPERSVGGSSGGQAGSISSRCSILGLGSDIGGSIRIPAEHCGVFGFKPYSKRISGQYHAIFANSLVAFLKVVPLCIGPMGKSAKDLALLMEIVTTKKNFKGEEDPYFKILPFDWQIYKQTQKCFKKYKIGFMKSLKDLEPTSASKRGLGQVIDILKKDGHQVVEVEIPGQQEIIRQFIGQLVSTKVKNLRQILQGQKPIQQYKTMFQIAQMWPITRYIVSFFAKKVQPRPYFYMFQKKPFDSILDYQKHVGQVWSLRKAWMSYWRDLHLDFIICPGFACQAMPHGKSEKLGLASAYVFLWNVLDMVVGSMPVTVVGEDQLSYESKYDDMITKELKQVAKQSVGLPAGVQIIGLPFEEQKVLGFMSYLQKKVQFYKKHPLPNV